MPTPPIVRRVRDTSDSKLMLFVRVVAGFPLLLYGGLHLWEPQEFQALLHAGGVALEQGLVVLVPLIEVVAGILLLVGVWVRVGGALAALAMIPAIHIGLTIASGGGSPDVDAAVIPQSPPLVLPIIVLVCALVVIVRGAGSFSGDYRATHPPFEK